MLRKRDDVVVFQTDKTGRFSVDKIDNYREACKVHTEKDETTNEDEHLKCQKEINAHATMWTRILKAGEEEASTAADRIKNNMLVDNHGLAPIYTVRKDHKAYADETIGPPVGLFVMAAQLITVSSHT